GYGRDDAGSLFRAFRSDGVTQTPLALPSGFTDNYANALNEAQHVVGVARNGSLFRAFFDDGAVSTLLALPPGDLFMEARALNGHDQAVGVSYDVGGHFHAFFWNAGTTTSLHTTFGGQQYSEANAINDAGLIVGSTDDADGNFHALRYNGATATALHGLTGYETTFGRGLNARGDLLGEGTTQNASRALLWPVRSLDPVDLGAFPGYVYYTPSQINSSRMVVGTAGDSAYTTLPAFLYDNGALRDLNALADPVTGAGWTLVSALGINTQGQIVGWGYHNGAQRGFLLRST